MTKAMWAVLLGAVVCSAGGCGNKGTSGGGKVELEVAIFKVCYGQDFYEKAAREYEKTHPNVKIKIWGNPRVWEQLRPRFVAGDPPDLVWPGWGLDVWALAAEDKLVPLDSYLDEKAYGQDMKWKDTFSRDYLELGKADGHYYLIPQIANYNCWWYNAKLFAKHGWQPPRTYEELLALCEQIKKIGIAPITYQGRYPDYMVVGYFIPWAISAGGMQAYKDAVNLKPGAWSSPAFLRAAEMIAEIRDRGYFQKGCSGMSHTEAQMEFVLDRAAMITCGTWLGAEMKNQTGSSCQLQAFLPPLPADGKCAPGIASLQREFWIVPKEGKHPEIAADFLRFFTSLEWSKKWVEEKHTLTAIAGSSAAKMDPYLAMTAQTQRGIRTTWNGEWVFWYPTLKDSVGNALASLLNGEVTPKECVARMEDAARKVRENNAIPKRKI